MKQYRVLMFELGNKEVWYQEDGELITISETMNPLSSHINASITFNADQLDDLIMALQELKTELAPKVAEEKNDE